MRLVGGQRTLLKDGMAIGRWISATLSVDPLPPDGFVVRGIEDDLVEITISSPAEHAGTFVVDPASLALGPVLLSGPTVQGVPDTGATVSALSGLVLYDPGFGLPVNRFEWRVNDQTVGVERDYTLDGSEAILGLTLRQTVYTSAGQSTIDQGVVSAPSYTERAVVFDGVGDRMTTPDPVLATSDEEALIFVSYQLLSEQSFMTSRAIFHAGETPMATGSRLLATASSSVGPNLSIRRSPSDTLFGVQPSSLGILDRAHCLIHLTPGAVTMSVRKPATDRFNTFTRSLSVTGGDAWQIANYNFSLGALSYSDARSANIDLYRAMVFPGNHTLDLTDVSCFDSFVNDDGTLKHPNIAEYQYGTPTLGFDGREANALTGGHRGSLGDLTVTGTPTYG